MLCSDFKTHLSPPQTGYSLTSSSKLRPGLSLTAPLFSHVALVYHMCVTAQPEAVTSMAEGAYTDCDVLHEAVGVTEKVLRVHWGDVWVCPHLL